MTICIYFLFNALSHLSELARRSYTAAHICRFSGSGIATNDSALLGHLQNFGDIIIISITETAIFP